MDDNCKILKKASVGNTDRCLEQWFLTEDGLYEVLFISRKPIAKQFRVWVRNIIKEIRLKGKYDLEKDEVHTMHLTDSLGREQETNMLKEQFKDNVFCTEYNI